MVSAHFSRWSAAVFFGAIAFGLMAAAPRDSATIVDSGSTNTIGYTIVVWSDGSASLTTQQTRNGPPSSPKAFKVAPSLATKFFTDLAAARKGNATTAPCMKSASFGTSLHVTWQGWHSPDLTCPPKDSLGTALVTDVDDIRKASGLSPAPLRQGPVKVESPAPP